MSSDLDEVCRALALAKKSPQGACLQVLPSEQGSPAVAGAALASVKTLGQRLAQALVREDFPPTQPLVILTPNNLGHALGNYATDWKQAPFNLIVIDEVPARDAHFVNIGKLHDNIVPITFYGMH